MIITNRSRVQFRGTVCTRQFDYYATKSGAVKCRIIYTPVAHNLRHLRGHDTQQLANLALVPDVHGLMMVLGLCMDDDDASRELFAALASSNLRADDDATCIIDYLNA